MALRIKIGGYIFTFSVASKLNFIFPLIIILAENFRAI